MSDWYYNDSANVNMSAGVLSTKSFAETLGSFILQGTATIDLGVGSIILDLADSHANTWTGTLSITNWDGSASGGWVDQLFFGNNGGSLTIGQLARIQFINPAGSSPGTYSAAMLPSGEIVAIPEPASGLMLIGGLGALAGGATVPSPSRINLSRYASWNASPYSRRYR